MYTGSLVCSAIALVACVALSSARPQLSLTLLPPPQQQQQPPQQLNNAINPLINSIGAPTNPIVVAAFLREAQLPPHMQSVYYKNPKIAATLAKDSWFGPGEQHAVDRETEKIPREKIYTILKNAGLLPTR